MGIRAQGNPLASFLDVWSNTGLDAVTAAPSGDASDNPKGHTATGGVISDWLDPSPGNVYRTHIFTSTGTFDVTASGQFGNNIDFLVIGGGGGGGYKPGASAGGRAGGGAGGLRTNAAPSYPNNLSSSTMAYPGSGTVSYTITVGGGGVRGHGAQGIDGTPSSIVHPSLNSGTGIVATGGGYGTYQPGNDGGGGGSGGGGAYSSSNGGATEASPDGLSPTLQGTAGGPGSGPSYSYNGSGGGGGAGAAGGAGGSCDHCSGDGGAGIQVAIAGPTNTTFTGVGAKNPSNNQYQYFAGGGGGGGGYPNGSGPKGAVGGVGGGGNGADAPHGDDAVAQSGEFGTGGGGGGGTGYISNSAANGGSGIVAVRYQIGTTAPNAKATGGSISLYNSKWIHTFTNSGTFATGPTWTSANVEYVVVGGGGAGNGGPGPSCGGGGGAGGFITNTNHPVGSHPVSVTVQIGAGAGSQANTRTGGTPSYFGTPLTAYGGGGGGRHINSGGSTTENGMPGGSGGGECDSQGPIGAGVGSKQTDTTTNAPITPQGNPGGAGAGNGGVDWVSGGGGGGAGQAGQAAVDQGRGGYGGYGKQLPGTFQNPASATSLGVSPNPTKYNGPNSGNYWFAGGGGGGASAPPYGLNALAGLGGGGQGYQNPAPSLPGSRDVMDALENTGGGGGSFHGPAAGSVAGSGGSGIVLIAYPST